MMTDLQEFKDQLRSIGVFCGDRSSVVESMPEIEVECTMEATRAQEIGRYAPGPKKIVLVGDQDAGKATFSTRGGPVSLCGVQTKLRDRFMGQEWNDDYGGQDFLHQGRLKLESTHLLHRHEVSYENLVCMQVHTACAGPCIGNVSWCCGRKACPFLWW